MDNKLFGDNRLVANCVYSGVLYAKERKLPVMPEVLKESDKKYLRAAIIHPEPAFTAVELAEAVEVTQQAAHSKLTNLEDRGLIRSKEVGSRARVWWVTEDGRYAYADSEL